MEPPVVSYCDARERIQNGDHLLFRRGDGLFSALISVAGRSNVSHAGLAVWLTKADCKRLSKPWPGLAPGLFCCHTVENEGGRLDRLSELVEKYPGRILVRKPLPELLPRYHRATAKLEALRIVGQPYGWWALRLAALAHLPIVRILTYRYLMPFMLDDGGNGAMPFCSMAVSRVSRLAGLDPVPHLADGWTEPGDMARSAVYEDYCYLGTDPQSRVE